MLRGCDNIDLQAKDVELFRFEILISILPIHYWEIVYHSVVMVIDNVDFILKCIAPKHVRHCWNTLIIHLAGLIGDSISPLFSEFYPPVPRTAMLNPST